MPSRNPVQYFRQRSARKNSTRLTATAKISSLTAINLQVQSFLFKLPGELRNLIFHYALLGSPDLQRPYSPHTYYTRPGYSHPRQIAVCLLQTCRRVYLETSLLPIALNEHVVYGGESSHAPPTYWPYIFPCNVLRSDQRAAIHTIHIFAHQFWLEDTKLKDCWARFCATWPRAGSPNTPASFAKGPEALHLTLRHTDWWCHLLGRQSPLALDPTKYGRVKTRTLLPSTLLSDPDNPFSPPTSSAAVGDTSTEDSPPAFEDNSWGSQFRHLHGLRTFTLELETLLSQRTELDEIALVARTWQFPIDNGTILRFDPDSCENTSNQWTGSAHFKGLDSSASSGRVEQKGRLSRHVWRTGSSIDPDVKRTDSSTHAQLDHDTEPMYDTLDYYTLTLQWRAAPHVRHHRDSKASVVTCPSSTIDILPSVNLQGGIAVREQPSILEAPAWSRGVSAREAAQSIVPSYYG